MARFSGEIIHGGRANMPLHAELIGADEVQRMIHKLGDKANKHLGAALLKAAEPITERAEELAPRSDQPTKAGHMADTITAEVRSKSGMNIEVVIGPDKDHFYGKFLELGAFNVWAQRPIPAQPFLRPALDEKEDEAIRIFSEEMRRELDL